MLYGRTASILPAWSAPARISPPALLAVTALAAALLAGPPHAAAAEPQQLPAEQARFFETRIRPLLVEQCVSCHGPTQQQSGLRLDSAAALRKGGRRGPLLVPGQPEASLLWKAASRHEGAPPMPPDRKLSDPQIADLARWIELGAPYPKDEVRRMKDEVPVSGGLQPSTINHQPSKTWWSFRPIVRPVLPKVKNAAWVTSPIDAFILAKLEAKGLRPAPPADRRTLIRRATFDLTGLPPTPEEVEQFLRECAAEERAHAPHAPRSTLRAYTRLVDRLLASSAYGERWGRHWLDVARYADSNGLDENVHYGNAWRYRDYVVRAFNGDRPFDRFLTEQIAGDLLPAESPAARNEQLIATGFLAVGPKFISEVDSEKVLMDLVDEQVDTLGRTVMGLTLGCARCHDHKFDPISTKDYYALAGIFHSTKTLDVMAKPRMWLEHPIPTEQDLALQAAHKVRVEEVKAKIAGATAEAKAHALAAMPGAALPQSPESAFPETARAELKKLRDDLARMEKEAPELPMAMGLAEGQAGDLAVHIRGDHAHLGEVVPRQFPLVLTGSEPPPLDRKGSGRLELARWLVSPSHPLTARVLVNRVWRWHFGRGIVGSTENFGLQGDLPTHPELLDWLACTFTAPSPSSGAGMGVWEYGSGTPRQPSTINHHPPTPTLPHSHTPTQGLNWSLKALHRLIMLSSTYQMSSAHDARAAGVDPGNRLHCRADIQRLDAEEVRDSLLAVSGLLDRTMGGKSLPLKNREYVFDHTSKDATRYDSRRRTLYLPVIRNNLYDVLQIFDFGDGAVVEGNRPTTTVAPQSLFMLNSDLVMDASEAMAGRALQDPEPDMGARVDGLYRAAYGRPATPKDKTRAAALLTRFQEAAGASGVPADQRPAKAWSWFCHTLLAANEFIYVK